MKNVIFLVVGLALGFVAGVFTGRCGAGANTAPAPASAATAKAEAVDDVFSGETKDGELVEIEEYGKFRLNPKQKEIVEKYELIPQWGEARVTDEEKAKKLVEDNPWILAETERMNVIHTYEKLMISLLESRKKAQANN